jgi:hypothetical protein
MKYVNYIIYILILLIFIPVVSADTCTITNLGDCLPESFFNYFLDAVNAPLELILGFIETLLSEPIDSSTFSEVWAVVIYIISMFYGLLLVYSGFNFLISGYDSSKREQAKSWLKNILIMILLVQASYLIYVLILDVNSALTTSVFNLIDSDFFVFTMDSFSEVASELMYGVTYLIILMVTAVILIIRYLIVSFGVVLFPIGIFFYFIEPLKGFGKSIINFLMINIFMSFFASLIFLISSMLLETTLFTDMKVSLMIASFALVDIMLVYFLFQGLIMGAISVFIGFKTGGLSTVIKTVIQKSPARSEEEIRNEAIKEYERRF